MILRYLLSDGTQQELKLGKRALTIGRSTDTDICIPDKQASRVHCGISFRDDAYFLRDCKSKNGTFVNNRRIDSARLSDGDRIRIGSTTIIVDSRHHKGTETVLREIKEEMDSGKGYHTMLLEIVQGEKDGK